MKDLMFLDNMLTPKVITVIYWLMLIASVIYGLKLMFNDYGPGFIISALTLIGGLIFSRIFCELLIIFFKMNEALQVIKNK